MGFEDVKIDGLSKEKITRETTDLLGVIFGILPYSDGYKAGIDNIYDEKVNEFEDEIYKEFEHYFNSLSQKWDVSNGTARADDKIYVRLDKQTKKIIFSNEEIKKVYGYNIISDYKEIPYYISNRHGKEYSTYKRRGGTPISAEALKKELDELKEVYQYDMQLNGNYKFKIEVDKDIENYNRYSNEIKYDIYNNISEILDEISKEYY